MQRADDRRALETPIPSPSPGDARHGADYSLHLVLLATVGFLLARLPVLVHRLFDPDEFEHAHAAWCVSKGMLPYKDFFEHHTPWYHYALRPFFHWFDVDLSFASARHFLLFGRGLSLLLTILSVVLVILIGRSWRDRKVGLLAGFLLVGQPVFLQKTLEIRPDVLALPFYLGALWFLLCGLGRGAHETRARLRCFLAGGLCLGAAIMCTQKMLFVLPGALAGLGIWSLFTARRSGPGSRLLVLAGFVLGIVVPAALTWGAFAVQHAGSEMIANNFLLNSKWKHVVHQQLLRLLETSWPVLLLSLLGATVSCYGFVRSKQHQYGDVLLVSILVGLIAGILVVPVAHRQYYLMPLPLACLFAAQGLSFLVDRAPGRARPWLLVLAIIVLSVLPLHGLQEASRSRNDRQLARLGYVFASTKPTDVVMDGWQGLGVFRPHAFHYFFLHEESLDMLPPAQVDAFLDALESGRIRPRLIALDQNLMGLGSRFLRFVKEHYVSDDGFFYLAKSGAD